MRTTISLEDRLLKRARKCAGEAGLTLSEWVARAVHRELDATPQRSQRKPFKLVTFGGGGLLPGYSWESLENDTVPLPWAAERGK